MSQSLRKRILTIIPYTRFRSRKLRKDVIVIVYILTFFIGPGLMAAIAVDALTPSNSSSISSNNVTANTTSTSALSTSAQVQVAHIPPQPGSQPVDHKSAGNSDVSNNDGSNGGGGAGGIGITPSLSEAEGFDDKAIQRAFMVLAGLGLVLIAYFGIKFACIKRRPKRSGNVNHTGSGRYGLIESSEMDLLDSIEEDDDESENDTLFDLRSHRHT